MMNNQQIRRFVIDTLGCTCPEEVFQHIECQTGVGASDDLLLEYEINVGNRLLVYVVAVDEPELLGWLIRQLVRNGTRKRDREGFNRFRLVLLTSRPADMVEQALAILRSVGTDERVHLHVIAKDDLPAENP